MPIDTSVKWFHDSMPGAPTLSNVAGSLIGLLDACLVNGFGTGNVDSIVIAGGIATVTRAAGHPFTTDGVDCVALIAGATVTGGSINGERKVLATPAPTSTTYCFDATGIANQTATGSITHKVAPAGWAKLFAGTNLAAYKPTDVTATGCVLRVDDTGTTCARVVGYESMSDINPGTGPFPTAAQRSGGTYWPKSNSGTRPWVLFADGRRLYLAVSWSTTYPAAYGISAVFGDVINTKSPDPYACLLYGATSDVSGSQPGSGANLSFDYPNSAATDLYAPRTYTGLGSATQLGSCSSGVASTNVSAQSGAAALSFPWPNPTDGGLYVAPIFIHDVSPRALRGRMPGIWFVPQAVGATSFVTRDRVTGVAGLAGVALRAVASGVGVGFIDTTGPWV